MAVDASGDLFIASGNEISEVVGTGAKQGQIVTVAGDAAAGYSGDDGPATNAELNCPCGVAVDASGDVFIADTGNNRIREILGSGAKQGQIVTLVGSGTQGCSGDSGPATSAELNGPCGLAVDAAGDLFIADTENCRIREVLAGGPDGGHIITVVGNGSFGYAGDNGPATNAELYVPRGVAVDASEDLFIADTDNNRVREVLASGPKQGQITTFAGTIQGYSGDNVAATATEINYPEGVAVDASGDVFIADMGNNRIREVLASGPDAGQIITVAGDAAAGYSGDNGPATCAELRSSFRRDSGYLR